MGWNRVDRIAPPTERPLLIRTREGEEESVAFLSRDGVWFQGGAMVQNSITLLGATLVEWRDAEEEPI